MFIARSPRSSLSAFCLGVTNDSVSCRRYSTHHSHKASHKKPVPKNCHYAVLGVSPKATATQIKHAYYTLSKIYHPDRNKAPIAMKKFQEIQAAYETLGTPRLRIQYDNGIFRPADKGVRSKTTAPPQAWRKASHPTGKLKMYNIDEHMRMHYSELFNEERKRKHKQEFYDRRMGSHRTTNSAAQQFYARFSFPTLVLGCLIIPLLLFLSPDSDTRSHSK